MKVKIPLSMKTRNLFSSCRKCKKGIGYHCMYCPKRVDKELELEKEAIEYVCKENPLVIKGWFIEAFKKYDKGKKVKYLKDCEIAEYEAYLAGAEPREKRIEELEAQIEKMNELINRYYEVCVQIPKEYRTMVFDSCLEDTRQLRR